MTGVDTIKHSHSYELWPEHNQCLFLNANPFTFRTKLVDNQQMLKMKPEIFSALRFFLRSVSVFQPSQLEHFSVGQITSSYKYNNPLKKRYLMVYRMSKSQACGVYSTSPYSCWRVLEYFLENQAREAAYLKARKACVSPIIRLLSAGIMGISST